MAWLRPSAAEIVATMFPGDTATADAAIDYVDREHRRLRHLLGFKDAP
jgi:hypothetical protein